MVSLVGGRRTTICGLDTPQEPLLHPASDSTLTRCGGPCSSASSISSLPTAPVPEPSSLTPSPVNIVLLILVLNPNPSFPHHVWWLQRLKPWSERLQPEWSSLPYVCPRFCPLRSFGTNQTLKRHFWWPGMGTDNGVCLGLQCSCPGEDITPSTCRSPQTIASSWPPLVTHHPGLHHWAYYISR